MARYVFHATHGVEFSEDGTNPWAKFVLDSASSSLVNGVTVRTYRFETSDAKIAARLRKIDDYGITEVKADKPDPDPAA
ncbi:hypothetical protein SAMN04244553_3594 [Nocardia amikacinitolerans]|uniref:Uncharacterized protein n=1 Tax=Nocardia amikacinitolerans TaxID=756689 RepID=A0A285LGI4_9NOCA|nr:hypothetical protein [Nocardia amikacinitolerans]SNY84079.1 hypothetical protein SAMN04244553_3594 [Nocardia amikacinitolerans]